MTIPPDAPDPPHEQAERPTPRTPPFTSPLQHRRPPRFPSDPLARDVLVGVALETSDGPCYRVRSDDGTEWGLHRGGGTHVERGQTVRAVLAADSGAPVHDGVCPGVPRAVVSIEVV